MPSVLVFKIGADLTVREDYDAVWAILNDTDSKAEFINDKTGKRVRIRRSAILAVNEL